MVSNFFLYGGKVRNNMYVCMSMCICVCMYYLEVIFFVFKKKVVLLGFVEYICIFGI